MVYLVYRKKPNEKGMAIMTEKQILKMIEEMQWQLNRMSTGRAKEIKGDLEKVKDYIKENK